MTNRWRTHTSEKLFLADLQIKAWREFCESDTTGFKPKEESFKQSVALLVMSAWESFLNELAEYHQQRTGLLTTLDQLSDVFADGAPEVEYLKELARLEGSWLSDLFKIRDIIRLPQTRESENPVVALASNALIATSESREAVDSLINIARILTDFRCYLDELRSRMSEW